MPLQCKKHLYTWQIHGKRKAYKIKENRDFIGFLEYAGSGT